MAVAVVVEEQVRLAGQAARPALHGEATILARLALSELGQVVQVDLHVAADEKVEPAVAVVVGEATAGRPAAPGDSGRLGDVGERAVPVVVVEVVPTEARDVDV